MRLNAPGIYAVMGSVIFGFICLMGLSFAQLSSIGRTLQSNTGENMLWMVSQTGFEGMRFATMIDEQSGSLADDDELLFRLDILESRVNILASQPQAGFIGQAGQADTLSAMLDSFAAIKALIHAGAQVSQIEAELDRFILYTRNIANAVMLAEREVLGAHFDAQRQATGTLLWAAVAIGCIGVIMAAAVFRALWQAQKTAAELQAHQEGLEAVVWERTLELQTVLEGERHAKEIYRSFITTVSHQFRTPLAVINMLSQRISRRSDMFSPAQISEKADNITRTIGRLIDLLNSVTNAARMDEHGFKLDRQPHNLADLTQSAVEHLIDWNIERCIEIDVVGDLPLVLCDASLVEQVLNNLIANAAKYSPPPSPILIKIWCDDDRVYLSLRDFGIGIPTADQPRIFQRFQRASNTENTSGSGLGLSLSRSIVTLHGGDMTFESQPGDTTFTFWLPLEPNNA